ncbi:hypothetical protein NE237_007161 [Protea cynaroides]|uniref:Glycosyltransferase 61 catalytic domain-containing protein n=1 Tax=Protea cynaroides TaxID=273540 RepID=A0A9Q0KNP5_9MAGN|nr:hypothetical protein NE237_007161 [Protea cynaroides]
MMYNEIFSKSFKSQEQKKFGYLAAVGSFILALSSFCLVKPYLGPLPIMNLRLSVGPGFTMLVTEDTSSSSSNSQPLNISSSQPSNTGSSQQLNNGSSQILTTNIYQKPIISRSEPSNIVISQPEVSRSSSHKSNRSSSEPAEEIGNSQQSNISTSQQLNIRSSQQSNIGSSEPANIGNSQHSNISSSQTETVGNSQQSDISSSQPLSTSSSQQSNKSSSQPENIHNSQQSNISSSQPSNIGNSQQVNISSSDQPLSTSSSQSSDITLKRERKPICDALNPTFDFCDAEGDVRIHGISSTVFVFSSQMDDLVGNKSWTVKPYARKRDKAAMGNTKEISVKAIGTHEEAPPCTLNHSVPAIIFSTGGYAGNHFHDFSDIIIPLFVASAQFQGEVQFVVTDFQNYWIEKFQAILKQLSKYEIINIDNYDQTVHCFPRVIVGLQQYQDMKIDPLMASKGYSMKEFRELLRKAYSLKKLTAIKISHPTPPRLLILSRKWSRTFKNVDEISEMARSLGFEVVVSEASMNMYEFSQVVNSCDVMMGVHGAGLTNIVFLPTNAILIQVLPWGGFQWLASDFGEPSKDMDLRYLEYEIKEEESSLLQQYPLDHPVFRDPASVSKHDWGLFKSVYLDKQNVKLDVGRFRPTLLEALELLHH